MAAKLARHFVSDDPPPALVARLKNSFHSATAIWLTWRRLWSLRRSVEPASIQDQDTLRVHELQLAGGRSGPLGAGADPPDAHGHGTEALQPPSPKGWPEEAQIWAAPDAVVKRMGWAEAFAQSAIADRDPTQLADAALGARLSPAAAKAISGRKRVREGLSILLMAPEFQRR